MRRSFVGTSLCRVRVTAGRRQGKETGSIGNVGETMLSVANFELSLTLLRLALLMLAWTSSHSRSRVTDAEGRWRRRYSRCIGSRARGRWQQTFDRFESESYF
jgi:hypothetical protein